jgi:hypothetical protein
MVLMTNSKEAGIRSRRERAGEALLDEIAILRIDENGRP